MVKTQICQHISSDLQGTADGRSSCYLLHIYFYALIICILKKYCITKIKKVTKFNLQK